MPSAAPPRPSRRRTGRRLPAAFLLLFPLFLLGQTRYISFEALSINDGLSQNSVATILQDSRGFMWFGTQEGLNRYDGYGFTVFRHRGDDPASLSDNWINVLYEGRDGQLWIGTAGGGLNRFDTATETMTRYSAAPDIPHGLSSDNVSAILEDARGELWIGTHGGGLNRFDPATGQFSTYRFDPDDPRGLPHDDVTALALDSTGRLWVGTAGGLAVLDENRYHFTVWIHDPATPASLSANRILALLAAPSGQLWIGTDGGGLNVMDTATGRFRRYPTDAAGGDNVHALFRDRAGTLWVGTDGGLQEYLPETDAFQSYRTIPDGRSATRTILVRSLFEDRSGILWIGSKGSGAYKFDRKKSVFTNYSKNPALPHGLNNNHIWGLCERGDGSIWIGTNLGVNRFDPVSERFRAYTHTPGRVTGLSHNIVRHVFEDRGGTLWLGTDGGGLNRLVETAAGVRFDHFTNRPDNPRSLSDNRIRTIFEDAGGELWVGTWNGLNRFDRAWQHFDHFYHDPGDPASLSDNRIRTLYQDGAGELWVGTYGGLNRFDRESGRFESFRHDPLDDRSLGNDRVLCLLEDGAGRLWVGTYGGGLNHFDHENRRFTRYTTEDGLPNNTVYGILEDGSGHLWLSTNKGLCRFDPESGATRVFERADGLQGNEFNGGAYLKTRGGELYFGGINGITRFRPEALFRNTHVPPVVLTAFRKYDRVVDFGRSPATLDAIELAHDDDFFSFEFAALDFANPGKNRYAYKLEGFDREWIPCGTRRSATYTNLDGGDYVFRVRACNNDGVWNEDGLAIAVTIVPPFWETWWFRLAVALAVALQVFALYRYRMRRVEAQQRLLETEVADRTRELNQRNNDLRYAQKETDDILNNVEEGLFLLNDRLEIGARHSAELARILPDDALATRPFLSLLNGRVPEKLLTETADYLRLMFQPDVDEPILADLNPLSEAEFHFSDAAGAFLGSRFLSFRFRRILDGSRIANLIVTVADVTEQVILTRKLEQSRQQTRKQMEWLLKILHVDPVLLNEFLESVRAELDQVEALMKSVAGSEDYPTLLDTIYRSIHLIKGNAALLDLSFFSNRAHECEEKILAIKESAAIDSRDFVPVVLQLGELRKSLGEVQNLIRRMAQFHREFTPRRARDQEVLIRSLRNLAESTARELEKDALLSAVQFDIAAIPFAYRLLIKEMLVQLTRNAVHHGIESPAERERLGKERRGRITLATEKSGDMLCIRFRDDGRGIDPEALLASAAAQGYPVPGNPDDREALCDILFAPGFTTIARANRIAGRGIGLDAIRHKVRQYGGDVTLAFETGQFCEFTITLPLGDDAAAASRAAEATLTDLRHSPTAPVAARE